MRGARVPALRSLRIRARCRYINAANTRLRMLNPAAPLIDRLAVVHPTVQPQATVVRQPPALPVAASVLPPAAAAAAKPPSAAAATAAAAAVAAVPVSAADVAAYWHERNALAKLYLAPFERFLEHVAPLVVGDNAKSNTFQTAVTTAKQMVEVLSGRDARLYPLDKLRKTGVGVMDFVNRLAEKMRAAAAARAASTASLPAAIVTATPVATAPVAAPVAPATLSLAACRYGLARWLDDADCALFCVLDSPIAPPKRARLAE